ncbi:hypothetical protein P7C73_g6638, partial [Tremellales sp. Uapishka_1]
MRYIHTALYGPTTAPLWRNQSIHLILDDAYDGLAETGGGEIKLSLKWVDGIRSSVERGEKGRAEAVNEFKGVLLHELVHTIQYDGGGTAPGWFIESLADYLRLQARLGPPHWRLAGQGRRERGWEEAYDAGARFFAWLEGEGEADGSPSAASQPHGAPPTPISPSVPAAQPTRYPTHQSDPQPVVVKPKLSKPRIGPFKDLSQIMNLKLKEGKWDDGVWEELTGKTLEDLWAEYLEWYKP